MVLTGQYHFVEPVVAAELLEPLKLPKTPKQRDRVARILHAARRAFAETSFDEVLMEDVAREAGVGKGTIYRYFPSKESLYFAVIFEGIEELKQQIRSTLTTQSHLELKIRGLIHTLVSFFHQNRLFFRLMNLEDGKVGDESRPNRQRWHRERGGLIDAIAAVLDHGRKTGSLDVVYPRTGAQILLGMVRSVLRHNEGGLTVRQMSDEITRIFFSGVGLR